MAGTNGAERGVILVFDILLLFNPSQVQYKLPSAASVAYAVSITKTVPVGYGYLAGKAKTGAASEGTNKLAGEYLQDRRF